MKSLKRSLFSSIIALVLCVSMLLGTTLAWFTDSVISSDNKIVAGNLDVEMYWSDTYLDADASGWQNADGVPVFTYDKWEPGYSEIKYIKVKNAGNLSLKWRLSIVAQGTVSELSDVIDVYFINPVNGTVAALENETSTGKLTDVLKNNLYTSGVLLPEGVTDTGYTTEETVLAIAFHMDEEAGNEYKGKSIGDGFALRLLATQFTYENDSFGNGYDENAKWPDAVIVGANTASVNVTAAPDGTLASLSTMASKNGSVNASVPAGVLLAQNTDRLTLTVKDVAKSDANITLDKTEASLSIDVHIDGVSPDNTVPIAVGVKELLPVGLNLGNFRLYHVENGATVAMTRIEYDSEIAHNTFKYDPATGDVTLYLKSFSEVALVADTENAWEGEFDYTWYDASKTELTIANADQLAAFSAIVGGMNGQTQDSFAGQTVKLLADINLGDKESENNEDIIFYPIGYWNNEGTYDRKPLEERTTAVESGLYSFCGIFDGNGHTISNFYHNTWEMKGDHNWYDPIKEQYYRDGMGLFGKVYGGTVKNLTVKNFSSDGEIATTGVIAAYADGATFENIAIFNCNPRVYNIGNGGIVGCVGWYAKEANLKTTFKNITVDNSNKISALWGSYDVACGGIVGQYYPTSGQSSAGAPVNDGISFENCHISAQMDVYNDVCGNYQYYAYRYAGMLIGSVRENETIDGHSYPKMDGITAEGCTVHFGTWNDYYYCEIIDNTTASYTHDYQMSRLTEIKAIDGTTITYLDGTTGTVPASGRANYVIVDYTKGHGTENATCYHFKDGAVWTHDMGGIQTGIDENGDGKDDLKEDKQHIYLEFNNLVTGYGWGVTTKGVGDLAGVTILDREVGNSVEKFEGKVETLVNNTTIKLGDIFSFVDKGVELVPGALTVTVTNVDENNPVSATIVYDRDNWEDTTITFSGVGAVKITIQDYYFCTPTTIDVNITARQPVEKFETKFTGDFLYRVGNANEITLGTLFGVKNDATIGHVSVAFETISGNATGSSFTAKESDWTKETIQFSGTGVVKVTITDNDYCIATELLLEVVDATNLISATGTTTGGTFVLLCDVNTSTYVNYWNCTLYGNGFTYSLNGAPTAYNSKQGHGILITKNAVLDNLVIVGDIYKSYGAYTNQDYYNTAVDVAGDTTIQNCYISGCAAPVRVRAGDANIKNTTLYGGSVANLIIDACCTTLENVITANYDDGRDIVGMGIVIHSDATESAKLVLNGTLTQYNFINESKVPADTYAKNLHGAMFNSDCSQYQFGTAPNRYVNTGIISLTSTFTEEDITDNAKTGYVGKALTVSTYKGYVYTQPNTSGSVNNDCPEYKPTTQGAVPPSYKFDYTNKNYIAKTDGSNDYCYEENGKVNVSMDDGDTFNWDTSILTIGKGITSYNVTMGGTDYTGRSIAFNTAGDYTVAYTYTDNNNYKLDENGNIITYSVTYTKTVNITVAVVKATTKHAEFTFGSSNTASTTVTVGNNTYVMPNVSATDSAIGSTTVDGQTIYYPIVEIIMSDSKTSHSSGWYAYFPVFSGVVTITDYADNGTGDKMTPYNGSTTTMPDGLSVVGTPADLFKYQSKSTAGDSPVVKNNKLVYSSAKIEANRDEYSTVIQYSYTDNAGATYYYYVGYHAPKQTYSSVCVTPDTLVTLADGTQKRIDQVTYDDQLLVWNFYTGKYDVASASIVMNHGYDEYTVVTLAFDDGTVVNTINGHGFFDVVTNQFVILNKDNAVDYIGHEFVKVDGDAYKTVRLVDCSIKTEYTESWSILTAEHYNCIMENMFTLTPAEVEGSPAYLMPFAIDGMKYDEVKMQADIEKYGLYTYADFASYMTEEQFVALGLAEWKISVAKGYITWNDILTLISIHLG